MSPHAARKAERWLESGPLDPEFYGALRGRQFTDSAEAALDFVLHGMPGRLSPHPFLDFVSLSPEARRAWRQGRVAGLLTALEGHDRRLSGPLAGARTPPAARARMLELAARLGREASGDPLTAQASAASTPQGAREPGRTSAVLVGGGVRRTVRTVEWLLHQQSLDDLEVLVLDPGSPPHVALGLGAALLELGSTELLRCPPQTAPAAAMDAAAARTTGSVLVLVDADVRPRRGGLAGLVDALDDPEVAMVQPLVLDEDDLILSAGVASGRRGGGHGRLLVGHPVEDAGVVAGTELSAVSGEMAAVRADDYVAQGGLAASESVRAGIEALSRQLRSRRPGGSRLVPSTMVTSSGADTGPPAAPTPAGLAARATDRRRRWSLSLPSPPGVRGDTWGDTHFAEALAAALRRQGEDVVQRRRGAHHAGPTDLDDVVLALRGIRPVPPRPGCVNVLWVISHPDEVDPREFDGYDVVCAASTAWSHSMSARSGRSVFPLLQATEFRPPEDVTPFPSEPTLVFVGSTDGRRDRRLVRAAADSGVPLAVWGKGWEGLPRGVWRGEYLDNHLVPEVYARHGVVLADHWPDMARNGFIANRVFDAVAAGAYVISDDVRGLHDVFDPADVAVARTPDDVADALEQFRASMRRPGVARASLSFDDRAGELRRLVELVTQES